MSSPDPDELLRRLRAVYCRHRCLTYEQYDELIAQERITFQEVMELVHVLFTEAQNMGLYDFIFQEEVKARKADQARLAEIERQLKRIGSVSTLQQVYAAETKKLIAEGNEIKQRLKTP